MTILLILHRLIQAQRRLLCCLALRLDASCLRYHWPSLPVP